jgi:hypothetical protein
MIPPSATAATTAAEVQLAGVPFPMTWVGCEVLTGWPPPPAVERATRAREAGLLARAVGRCSREVGHDWPWARDALAAVAWCGLVPQPTRANMANKASKAANPPIIRMAPHVSHRTQARSHLWLSAPDTTALIGGWQATSRPPVVSLDGRAEAAAVPSTSPGGTAAPRHPTGHRAGPPRRRGIAPAWPRPHSVWPGP